MGKTILCSDCFKDYGLKKMAERIGTRKNFHCPNCGSETGVGLDLEDVRKLCSKYFVEGSYNSVKYGGSPILMMVDDTFGFGFDYSVHKSLEHDLKLINKTTGSAPTDYGPAMWKVGITEWLERLTSKIPRKRNTAIEELVSRCRIKEISTDSQFYRIRTNVTDIVNEKSFDAPKSQKYSGGRFNVKDGVVFYASFDVETCIHECRVNMEDLLYVATFEPCSTLRLMNLNDVEEEKTEETPFEDLSIAINQIFKAGSHSYGITRKISQFAKARGLDGVIYPSYFNSVRERPHINIALYGQVIKNKKVRVKSIDRILLDEVSYKFNYGPCFNTDNVSENSYCCFHSLTIT